MERNSCKHSPLQFQDAEFEFAAEPLGACSVVGDDSDHEHLPLEDHDLNEIVANEVFSTQSSPQQVKCVRELNPEDHSPEGVLRQAIMLDEPMLNFPLKRLKRKQVVPIEALCLHRLRQDVTKSCGFPVGTSREVFDKGRWTYIRACQRLFGGKVPRATRAKCFGTASMVVRQNFVFLCHLWERLYKSDQKKGVPVDGRNWRAARIPLPNGRRYSENDSDNAPVRETWGMLLTVHSTVGLSNAEIVRAVQQGLRGEELLAVMKQVLEYKEEFGHWTRFVKEKVAELGFQSWATCMELGTATGQAITVHVHAFMGPEVRTSACWGRSSHPQQVRVRQADLSYKGEDMFVSYMRPFGPKHVWTLACCGLYYLRGPKVGSLFNVGNREPFQDSSP